MNLYWNDYFYVLIPNAPWHVWDKVPVDATVSSVELEIEDEVAKIVADDAGNHKTLVTFHTILDC